MSLRRQTAPETIYGDFSSFAPEERQAHSALRAELFGAVHRVQELGDGYAFLLPGNAEALAMAARFLIQERRCCPFLRFALQSEPPHDRIWMRLTAGVPIKPFLGEELGHLLPEEVQADLQPQRSARSAHATRKGALRFQLARPADLPAAQALLKRCGLPAGDMHGVLPNLLLATLQKDLVGCIGLEVHGRYGLLRSLAVAEAARGRGLGHALYARIVEHARQRDLGALYLLTLDAAEFFAQRGFTAVPREAVPEVIRATAQFRRLCPATAVSMERRLTP